MAKTKAKSKKVAKAIAAIPPQAEGVPSFQLENFEERVVSRDKSKDRWCYRPELRKGRIPFGDDPYGYIYSIPKSVIHEKLLITDTEGFIVRHITLNEEILIQYIPKEWFTRKHYSMPEYGIQVKYNLTLSGILRYYYIIRNLHKKNW